MATPQQGPGENQVTPTENVEEPHVSAPPRLRVKPCPMHPESLREKCRRHRLLCESIGGRSPAETQRRRDMGEAGLQPHHDGFGETGEAAKEPAPIVVREEDAFAVMAPLDDKVPVLGHPEAGRASHDSITPTRRRRPIIWM